MIAARGSSLARRAISVARTPVASVQPEAASIPARASRPRATRPGKAAQAASRNAGSRIAAVPTMATSAPTLPVPGHGRLILAVSRLPGGVALDQADHPSAPQIDSRDDLHGCSSLVAWLPDRRIACSSRQARKILQEPEAGRLALLRMELRREEVVAPDHRGEPGAVVGDPRRHVLVRRLHVIGMDEVEEWLLGEARQNGRRPHRP